MSFQASCDVLHDLGLALQVSTGRDVAAFSERVVVDVRVGLTQPRVSDHCWKES